MILNNGWIVNKFDLNIISTDEQCLGDNNGTITINSATGGVEVISTALTMVSVSKAQMRMAI